MYEFATVALLGLAVCKLVDLGGHLGTMSRAAKITLAVLAGVGLTWLLDYNVYAGWDQLFRKAWMGTVGTGLTIAGISAVWHEILDVLASYSRRSNDQATEIESRIPRAA
ncbi:MAG: hypothetical protein ABR600_03615 [Actinomycetota bacterium]